MVLFILISVILLIVLFSWLYVLWDSTRQNLPGPFPLPIIGSGHMFLVDAAKFLTIFSELAVKYSDAFRFYVMSERYVVLSHPKYVQDIISSTVTITKGHSYDFVLPWLGRGLLTSTGNKWRNHRKFLTPAFHYNILQSFLPVFLKNEKILCHKLKGLADGTLIDLFPILALATLDNVAESIMAVSFHAQENSESEYVKAIEAISLVTSARMRNLFYANETIFNFTSLKKAQDDALATLHGHTRKVINMRRKELEKQKANKLDETSEIGLKNKHAFLDLLLLAEVNGKPIEDEMIREEVDTFMFEGHDTTASGLAFCLYCIAKYPDIQKKILDEQMDILGGDLDRDPTYTELQEMKYLECVIKESLRLYPSVPMIQRLITNDIDMSGMRLLKDTSVIINIFHLQRHPDLFDDPLEFRPERFDGTTPSKGPFSWIAFSAGPRNCIGQKFAMLEMKVTLACIVNHFEILPSGIEPQPCDNLVLRSQNGVFVKMLPRKIKA